MRLYGLIGYPLTHSFSEKYFAQKFEREGIHGCRYESFPMKDIDQLGSLLLGHPELKGLNVTIPYKKVVIKHLHEKHLPEGLEACNVIDIRDGKLTGYNTDWTAFRDSLQTVIKPHHSDALVLGTGGAAEAVIYALKKMDIPVSIVSRHISRDSTYTYNELNKQIIEQHNIIINTTPLGLYPDVNSCPQIPYEYITPHHILFDLIYNPERTLFLQKGKKQGATIKNGEEMLVMQAEESWKIWNR
jgi:shikimate dehydrogenase